MRHRSPVSTSRSIAVKKIIASFYKPSPSFLEATRPRRTPRRFRIICMCDDCRPCFPPWKSRAEPRASDTRDYEVTDCRGCHRCFKARCWISPEDSWCVITYVITGFSNVLCWIAWCVCEMISRLVAIECLLTANVCRFFLLNTKRNVWIIVETRRQVGNCTEQLENGVSRSLSNFFSRVSKF